MKKLLTLQTALLLVVILCSTGCDDCKEGCCKESRLLVEAHTNIPDITFNEFTGTISATALSNHVYYYYVPTVPQKVQFFVAVENANICTKEHLNFDFGAFVSDVTPDRALKIFGEVYWGNDDDELILYSGIPTQNHLYAAQLSDIGLKQQFPEGPATLRLFMTVEFESLGSLDLDKAYFLEHIEFINASYYYYEYV